MFHSKTFLAMIGSAMLAVASPPLIHAEGTLLSNEDAISRAQQSATKLTASPVSVQFSKPEVLRMEQIQRSYIISDDPGFMNMAAQGNTAFASALENPIEIKQLGKITTPTPVKAGDRIVAALPFDVTAVVPEIYEATVNGAIPITVHNADTGEESSLPIAPPTSTLRWLYAATNSKAPGTGLDAARGITPQVMVGTSSARYDSQKVNGNNPDPKYDLIGIAQEGTTHNLTITRHISNSSPDTLERTIQPMVVDYATHADGTAEGWKPLGEPVTMTIEPGATVDTVAQVPLHVPGGTSQVFLLDQIKKLIQNNQQPQMVPVAPAAVFNVPVEKLQGRVTASTEEGSSRLIGKDKQNIFNEVELSNLMPGKPYNVVQELHQCSVKNCVKIAAVNREIIPRTMQTVQHFSAQVDPHDFADGDTYEWVTRVFEGTGDFANMGTELLSAISGDYEVLSLTGAVTPQLPGRIVDDLTPKSSEQPAPAPEQPAPHAEAIQHALTVHHADEGAPPQDKKAPVGGIGDKLPDIERPRQDRELEDKDRMVGSADVEDARQETKVVIVDKAPQFSPETVRTKTDTLRKAVEENGATNIQPEDKSVRPLWVWALGGLVLIGFIVFIAYCLWFVLKDKVRRG